MNSTYAIAIVRAWAVMVAAVYAVLMIAVGSVWMSSPAWGGPAMFPFLAASAVFALAVLGIGVDVASRRPRELSWLIMLVGAAITFTFALVLVPLVLTASPAAFTRLRPGGSAL